MFIVKRKSDGKWYNKRGQIWGGTERFWVDSIEKARAYATKTAAQASLGIVRPRCIWRLQHPDDWKYGDPVLPKPSKKEVEAEVQRRLAKYELYEVTLGQSVHQVDW